jgi:NTP pyrophosphatase (non-canonical NTP hydrolase)
MKPLDLDNLMKQIKTFSEERDWDQFHSVKNLSMALSVESSELVEIFQWLTEEQSNNAKNDPKIKMKASEEVADIFIYLLRVVGKLEIDLDDAVRAKLIKNAEKYPVELAKGSAKKYIDLK